MLYELEDAETQLGRAEHNDIVRVAPSTPAASMRSLLTLSPQTTLIYTHSHSLALEGAEKLSQHLERARTHRHSAAKAPRGISAGS